MKLENKSKIERLGGIEVILQCMKLQSEVAEVQESGCLVLYELAIGNGNLFSIYVIYFC